MYSSCSCGTIAEMVFSSSHSLFQKFGRGWGRGRMREQRRRSGGFKFKMSLFFVVFKITWKHLNFKKNLINGVSVFVILSPSKEHYYDGESGTGYLAWRIKTIQRSTARDRRSTYDGNAIIILEEYLKHSFFCCLFFACMFKWLSKYGIFPYCVGPSEGASHEDGPGGPAARREPQFFPETVLSEDEYKEAIALMKHSADENTI